MESTTRVLQIRNGNFNLACTVCQDDGGVGALTSGVAPTVPVSKVAVIY